MPVVTITTPARLHLGQIDLNGDLGRKYGGMGVAIDKPYTQLEACFSSQINVRGKFSEEIKDFAEGYLNFFNIKGGIEVTLNNYIPRHMGMGSTTQLALAVGIAVAKIYGIKTSILELARITDRGGSRSGIGVGAFMHGGFIVDGGKPLKGNEVKKDYVPPVIIRHPFPENWRFIVAVTKNQQGISGTEEETAFKKLSPMKEERVESICRKILIQLLPALADGDIKLFGEGITEIQRIVGEHFKPVQNGIFASKISEDIVNFLLKKGAAGAGQSSWGPTVYGLVEKEEGEKLLEDVRAFLGKRGYAYLAKVVNEGAKIRVKQMTRGIKCEKNTSSVG